MATFYLCCLMSWFSADQIGTLGHKNWPPPLDMVCLGCWGVFLPARYCRLWVMPTIHLRSGDGHSQCDGGWGGRTLAAAKGPWGQSKSQGAEPHRHLSSQGPMGVMGSPEAVGPSEEDKTEGVSRPKQGHARAKITLMQRQVCALYWSHAMTTSVQTRYCGTQRDLLVPENYWAPHFQTNLTEACLGDCSGF